MNTKLIAIAAAALISTTALTPAAQAGVRVGFGFPLGAIVATQALGSMAKENRRQKAYQQQQTRQERAAAKKRQQQQAAAARAEAKAKKQAAAAAAQRNRVAKQKAKEADTTNVATTSTPDATPAPSVYIPGPTAPVAAGVATAGALPAPTELKDATPAAVSNQTVEEGNAVAANTATSTPVDAALSAETDAVAQPASAETTPVVETGSTARECRKYFPTVGRLVTVACDE